MFFVKTIGLLALVLLSRLDFLFFNIVASIFQFLAFVKFNVVCRRAPSYYTLRWRDATCILYFLSHSDLVLQSAHKTTWNFQFSGASLREFLSTPPESCLCSTEPPAFPTKPWVVKRCHFHFGCDFLKCQPICKVLLPLEIEGYICDF